jgi:hypothetical protein
MTVRGYALLLRAGSASDRWLVPALALGARIRGAGSHMKVEVGQPAQRPVLLNNGGWFYSDPRYRNRLQSTRGVAYDSL